MDCFSVYVNLDQPNIDLFYSCEQLQGFGRVPVSRKIRRCREIRPRDHIESRDGFLRIGSDQIQYPARGVIGSDETVWRRRAIWRDTNLVPIRFRSLLRSRIESFVELAFKLSLDFFPGDSWSGVIGSAL